MRGLVNHIAFFAAALIFSLFFSPGNQARAADYILQSSVPATRPTAVALDDADNIYIAEAARNRIVILDHTGENIGRLSGLAKPISVALDSAGHLYVGNDDRDNVEVYGSNNSGFSLMFKLGSGDGEIQKPSSIALDDLGNIYVVDSEADLVRVYNADGTAKFSFGGTGSANGLFNFPTAIAIDQAAQKIVVADLQEYIKVAYHGPQKGARLQMFDMAGAHELSFARFGQGDGFLTKPLGLNIDRNGDIYVTDAYQHVVQVFNSAGVFVKTIYDLSNPMRTPLDIAISRQTDRLYVASMTSSMINIYGLDISHTITTTTSPGGSITPAGPLTVGHGDPVSYTITPDAGYKTGQVLLDGVAQENLESLSLIAVTDHTVEVVFARNAFTVTAAADANGSVDPAGASEVTAGGSLTVAVTPAANHHLAALVVDGQNLTGLEGITEYTFADVWANHTLNAEFAIDTFTVDILTNAMGDVSVPDGGVVSYGGTLTVTILPRPGFKLVDVLVDGLSVGPVTSYTFTNITTGHTVEPIFIEILHTLIAIPAMGGEVVPAGEIVVKQGAGLDYIITPAPGYVLLDVLVDGASLGPIASYSFVDINADHTIAPVFAESRLFERFETGNLKKFPWRTGGTSGWQTQDTTRLAGNYSVQAPAGNSFLEMPLETTSAADISFWFSVSGAGTVKFMIDGSEQANWRGNWGSTNVGFAVDPGQHIFRWEFSGSGNAWLDDIVLPPYAAPVFPMLDLKANNSDGPLSISHKDSLTLSVMAAYGGWQPPRHGSWVITRTNAKSADKDSDDKKDSNKDDDDSDDSGSAGSKIVTFQGPVPDGPVHTDALTLKKMPRGDYIFTFGVYEKKGSQPLYQDTVEVHVTK